MEVDFRGCKKQSDIEKILKELNMPKTIRRRMAHEIHKLETKDRMFIT